MSKEFGQRLLNQMKKQGISQRQLADRLNTTEASLSRYVNGDTTSDYLLGIENNDFDFPKVERLLARNSSKMSDQQRRALITALFGED